MLAAAAHGRTASGSAALLRLDREEREIEYVVVPVQGNSIAGAAVIVRDVSEARRRVRNIEALQQIASSVAFGSSLETTLNAVARSVVTATRAAICAIALSDEQVTNIQVFGVHGIPTEWPETAASFSQGIQTCIPAAAVDALRAKRCFVDRDARKGMLMNPHLASMHERLRVAPWDTVVGVPMCYQDRLVGVVHVFYPHGRDPDESEVAFLTTIADHAAVAVENARLFMETKEKAALEERQRLARELHDSASQVLYGIALGARTARTLLDRTPAQAAEPLDYVVSLAEAGLAEMRALIFQLRPESLETEGLIAALSREIEVIRSRHGIGVRAALPSAEPDMTSEVKQAVYRIVQEALHNVVKHARARQVDLGLACRAGEVTLEISDDGVGFDTQGAFPGHLGLRSMRERTATLGGTLEVRSAPAGGTCIRVRIPCPTVE
jgi:signal transduction histidine kinase